MSDSPRAKRAICTSAVHAPADAVRDELERNGVPRGVGLPAVRAALTGSVDGLRLGELLTLLGLERSRQRVAAALE